MRVSLTDIGQREREASAELFKLPRLFSLHTPALRLSGTLVQLRPPERGDWQEWATLREASRNFLTPWEPSWPADALSRSAFRRRVGRHALDWRTDQGYSFFLFEQAGGRLAGGIGLTNIRRGVAETGSLGYWVGEPFARRGYMTEALALVLDFAFQRLRLHRVEAACLPSNGPSRGVLAKTGFREEGYAEKYLCIDGKWQDHVLYAMLREEWRR